jgi:hypothetical protein
MMKLVLQGLVDVSVAEDWINKMLGELVDLVKHPKTDQSEENVVQIVEFLFQVSSKLTPNMATLKDQIAKSLKAILAIPRSELPSLNMRTKFKIEDTLKKCV